MLQNKQVLFIILTPLVLAALVYFYYKLPFEKKFIIARICLLCLCGGAIGNLIDRIFNGEKLFHGYVVDMIYVEIINFPVFNIADSFITVGFALMIFSMVLVTIFLNSLNPCLKTGASNAAIPSPAIKASTSAVITSIIPQLILQIYTDDLALAAAAIPSVYVIAVATVLGAVGMVYFEAVSGTGNTSAAMALEFGVLIVYVFYVYLMTKTSTIAAVWTAEWFYNTVMGLIAFFYIWEADWRKKVI